MAKSEMHEKGSALRRDLRPLPCSTPSLGSGAVFPAAMGIEGGWMLRAAHHSPRYTTRLDELPRVRA